MVLSRVGSHGYPVRVDLSDGLITSPSFLKFKKLHNEDLVTKYLKMFTKRFQARALVSHVYGKQRFCCHCKKDLICSISIFKLLFLDMQFRIFLQGFLCLFSKRYIN